MFIHPHIVSYDDNNDDDDDEGEIWIVTKTKDAALSTALTYLQRPEYKWPSTWQYFHSRP